MVQKEPVIEFSCPECGASLTADASQAGDSGPCPDCGTQVTCPYDSTAQETPPGSATATQPTLAQPSTAARPKRTQWESGPRIFRDAKEPQPATPLPAPPRQPSAFPKWASVIAVGALLVLLLAFLARLLIGPGEYPSSQQGDTRSEAGPQPTSQSLEGTSPSNPLDPQNPDDPGVALSNSAPSVSAEESPLEGLLDTRGDFDVPSVDDPSALNEPGLLDPDPQLGEDPLLPSDPGDEGLRFENPDFPTSGEGSVLEGAREFIGSYTSAPTWEALVPMTRDGEALRSEMESHYAQHPYAPDPVTALSFVNTHAGADGKSRYFIYMVSTQSHPDGFLMNVESTGDSYLANWRPYVEFKEKLFETFASTPKVSKADERHSFHVFLSRAHYFGDEVPEPSEKMAFEASIPAGEKNPYTVFVPLYTDLGRKLDRELQWGRSYLVVADFRWSVDPNDDDATPYLRLMQIRRYSWQQSLEEAETP